MPLIKNKTAPIPVQKKIKGVPTQCLLIKTPGHRDFFVSPEAPLAEWSDMISKLEPPPNAADLRHQTIGDRPVEAVKLDDPEVPEDDEEEESTIVHSPKEALAANAKIELHPDGVLSSLSAHSHSVHPESHTKAVLAPEEADRVPMLQRGVTLAFLRRMVKELTAHGRGGIDCGQFLNGTHTTSSATDWKECVLDAVSCVFQVLTNPNVGSPERKMRSVVRRALCIQEQVLWRHVSRPDSRMTQRYFQRYCSVKWNPIVDPTFYFRLEVHSLALWTRL